jgi:biopolymer transport protein ExbD
MKLNSQIREPAIEQPNLCSFSDVVFQLLIFFMLTVQFSDMNLDRIKLPQSEAKTIRTTDEVLILNVRQDGTVTAGGKVMSADRLENEFKQRRDKARNHVVRGDSRFVNYYVNIRADRSADFADSADHDDGFALRRSHQAHVFERP